MSRPGPAGRSIAEITRINRIIRAFAFVMVGGALFAGCGFFDQENSRAVQTYGGDGPGTTAAQTAAETTATTTKISTTSSAPASSEPSPDAASEDGLGARPAWLGSRTLPTTKDGSVVPQTTPEELTDRRLPTVDTLPPPPPDAPFQWTAGPVDLNTLNRSTWEAGCPVTPEDLTYLTMSFWGFDGKPHTGEMMVNSTVADDIVSVFATLFDNRYPIEEMRLVTPADLAAPPTGDGNNTGSFVCRQVTGGTRFSQHAYGLAIDVNPFLNPYRRGDLVLPELATSYLDRGLSHPGVITEGDVVVTAFETIGWSWGGRWTSLKDYQHFSQNGR